MAEVLVAKRYAKALVDLAIEKDQLEVIKSDLALVLNTVNENADLGSAFYSPVVSDNRKEAIITSLFADKVNATTIQFLKLLLTNRRESALSAIVEEFGGLYNTHKGLVLVNVTTATPLASETREALLAKLSKEVEGTLILKESVDAKIIGGMIVRIGDKQINASISHKLNELKKSFSSNL